MVRKLALIMENIIKNQRKITNRDIAQILSVMVQEKDLRPYLEGVTFTNIIFSEDPDLIYSYNDRRLIINSSFKDSKPAFMDENFKSFSDKDNLILQILNIIYRLAMEIEKINQWHIASSSEKNLTAVIIRANILHKILFAGLDFAADLEELPLSIEAMRTEYDHKLANHKTVFNPLDHLANFYASMLVLDITSALAAQTRNITNFIQASIMKNLIKDYKTNVLVPSAPTIDFFNEQNFKGLFKDFAFYSPNTLFMKQNISESVPLTRRLQCGLTIKPKELKGIRNQYIELIS